jgi:hypothetical protein
MVGDYQVSLECACVETVDLQNGSAHVYIYDTEARLEGSRWYGLANEETGLGADECQIRGNRCNLLATAMVGPEVVTECQQTELRMRTEFSLQFDTGAYAAQAGVVHLVQSQRSLLLENGLQRLLLATDEPVLYVDDPLATEPVHCLAPAQQQGQNETYQYQLSVKQAIPDLVDGEAVASVTVLEQYQTYFLQRECSHYTTGVIWTPLLAPVTWGWSIRVGRRADGEWGILRQKVIRPTVGHDGLELPQWQTNSLALCQTSVT